MVVAIAVVVVVIAVVVVEDIVDDTRSLRCSRHEVANDMVLWELPGYNSSVPDVSHLLGLRGPRGLWPGQSTGKPRARVLGEK